MSRSRVFWSDGKGAVAVEFLVAFLPVFVFFLCLLQLALLFSSKLLVEHSAVQGARGAAVIFGDEAGPYGDRAGETNALSQGRRQAVRDAVLISLAPLILDGSLDRVDVRFPTADAPGGKDQPEDAMLAAMATTGPRMMRVHVEAAVVCKIALANVIMCSGGTRGPRVAIATAESLFPYQGASYVYE